MINIFIIIGYLATVPNSSDAYFLIKQKMPFDTMSACVEMMVAINAGRTGQVAACVQRKHIGENS